MPGLLPAMFVELPAMLVVLLLALEPTTPRSCIFGTGTADSERDTAG